MILHADAAGYSARAAEDEEAAVRGLGERRTRLDAAIAAHGGRIANTAGDSVLAEFASPVEAVRAAIKAQDEIEALNASAPVASRLSFRIGINLGDVISRGGDLLGDGVNVAARLQQACPPGGVWIAGKVAAEIRGKLALPLQPRGALAFKNLPEPVPVFAARAGPAGPAWNRLRVRTWIAAVALIGLVALAVALAAPWMRERLWGRDSAAGPPMVAVLPFDNRSGDPAETYFVDGVTDDVIAALGRFPHLIVLSRQAALPYRARPLEDAARELGARYVVTGSVQKSADRVRVSAALADVVQRGRQVWSDDFDERLEDVFVLQQRLAREAAGHLSQSILRVEQERAMTRPTANLDAYEAVLRGREANARGTRSANRLGRELFRRAIELDPRYAGAHAAFGNALFDQVDLGWTEFPDETLARAEEEAAAALAIEPENVEARWLRARTEAARGRYEQAIAESERALRGNPSDADAHAARGVALAWSGRTPEAVDALRRALRINPTLSSGIWFTYGLALYLERRHAECIRVLEEATARWPTQSFNWALIAAAHAQLGDDAETRQAAERAHRLQPVFDLDIFGSRLRDKAQRDYLREGLVRAAI